MGASKSKSQRNAPPSRRRKHVPKLKWQKRNETVVVDETNNRHSVYEDQARGNNFQDNNYNPTPSFGNEPYYNDQSYNNLSSGGYSQDDNTKYEEEGSFPNSSSVGHIYNADQNYSNYSYDAPGFGGNFSTGQSNGEYFSRRETYNYNYGMIQPSKPLRRCNSLNNDFERPQFSHSYQNNFVLQAQYHSLNNLNDRIYYDRNTFQNRNSYSDRWGSRQRISARVSRSNSTNGITEVGKVFREGKKRNSLDEDFDGEDYNSNPLPDHHWEQRYGAGSNIDVSYVGPKVKRKLPNERHEDYFERNGSAPSSRSNTPSGNYYGEDFAQDNWDLESPQSEQQSNCLNILRFPSEWTCSPTNTGFVDILPSSMEGGKLMQYFYKTARSTSFQLNILGITRIENPFLHTLFLLKKEEMKLRNGHVDELHLYHGTKQINVPEICENNLNWRLIEKHRFGKGISFSPLATYSSHYCDDTDVKVMLLFKVLVSNAVVGTSNMSIPPIFEDIAYDTSIKEDVSVIVKYSDNEFYPLYKIMFKKRRL